MVRSFDNVDNKVAESEFFLCKLNENDLIPELEWYLSAFVSASRSITFSLQAVMSDVEGFACWYKEKQETLKLSSLAHYFVQLRNLSQKTGATVVNKMTIDMLPVFLGVGENGEFKQVENWFGISNENMPIPPNGSVEANCIEYFCLLLNVVYDCYIDFGSLIDPRQRYTSEYFANCGKTIEDAEEEVFGHRGWTEAPGIPMEYRWQMLRDEQGSCQIMHIFSKYLKQDLPQPTRLSMPRSETKDIVYMPLPDEEKTGDPKKDLEIFLNKFRK